MTHFPQIDRAACGKPSATPKYQGVTLPQTRLLRLRATAAGIREQRLLARFLAIPATWKNRHLRVWAWAQYEAARAHEGQAVAALFATAVFSAPLYQATHMEVH